MATTRVDCDFNARAGELLFSGFEHCPRPVSVGEHVLAWQPDDELVADALVYGVNEEKRLVYLLVDWDTLRDDDGS